MFAPSELLWAVIGLILTIGCTWIEAFVFGLPISEWLQGEGGGIEAISLGVSFQVGAVLFTGCMGGKNAAALSQIAYIALGVLLFEFFGLEIFAHGAGIEYVQEPSFGYLLGFVPAGWLCGLLAFRSKRSLERIGFAALCGLVPVHLCGMAYLIVGYLFRWLPAPPGLGTAIMSYSIVQIPGQVMVSCAIALIAFGLRKLLFY
ncbi:BioY family [Synechococcus sp. PCC 7335]|uniref:biotin transporter BioY n=1 Tax=Synechococcus sp. (strain ATCC 29403 / PCC 7335) TaxID=91464 RepID=UPI00017EC781|nr:biotin transporter BioY [Synechococcus sp. PCC 7335]EDX87197.1 BioY family [Synechococcus sp. PCC 7335]